MNDIVYLTKRFETISIKTKHYPGRGSTEEIATLSDWKDGNAVSNCISSSLCNRKLTPIEEQKLSRRDMTTALHFFISNFKELALFNHSYYKNLIPAFRQQGSIENAISVLYAIAANVLRSMIETMYYPVIVPVGKMHPNYLGNSQLAYKQGPEYFRDSGPKKCV